MHSTRWNRRTGFGLAAAVVGLVLVGVSQTGCQPDARTAEWRLAETGAPAMHAVHSDQLREAMREINMLNYDRIRMEVYTGSRVTPDLGQIAAAADKIAETAGSIPAAVETVEMTEAERSLFVRLAEKLRTEAQAVSRAAATDDVDATRTAMERMTATCNACHASFRIAPEHID